MILITGGNGFIGSGLAATCSGRDVPFRSATRLQGPDTFAVGEIDAATDWSAALRGVTSVVHLAGIAHRISAKPSLEHFRFANVDGSVNLARQAALAGAQRFVFVSSIGVLGQTTPPGASFSERSPANPLSPYARSKYEAELALKRLCADLALQLVIVRPPLVYGRNAKGNYASLVRLVASGCPLPFASVDNRRNMISLRNMADALLECATHPKAAGETFVVAEKEAVSTPDVIRAIAQGMCRKTRLIRVPPSLLNWGLVALGHSQKADGLLASLEIDSSRIRAKLGWTAKGSTLDNIVADLGGVQKR